MVTIASVPPFTEVFNTYGERLTNAQLLGRYGFLLDGNEYDALDWSTREMCGLLPHLVRGIRVKIGGRSSSADGQTGATSKGAFNIDAFDPVVIEKMQEDVFDPSEDEIASIGVSGAHVDLSTTSAMSHQLRDYRPGQVVLDRLTEIVAVWPELDAACSRSTLIYISDCDVPRLASNELGEECAKEAVRSRYRTDIGPSSRAAFEDSHEGCVQEGIEKTYCVSASWS